MDDIIIKKIHKMYFQEEEKPLKIHSRSFLAILDMENKWIKKFLNSGQW